MTIAVDWDAKQAKMESYVSFLKMTLGVPSIVLADRQ